MFRYLILSWDPLDSHASAAAESVATSLPAQWQATFKEQGVFACHAGVRPGSSEVLLLPEGRGAVFGKLFKQGVDATAMPSVEAFDIPESSSIVATSGQRLIERYWGRYVAVIRDAAAGEICVMRDPSGALPCFFTLWHGVSIFFADVEDCLALGIGPFSINWQYIAAFVPYSALQIRATGLHEVSEVQAGERVRLRGGLLERSFAWNPVRIAQGEWIENIDAAAIALRRTTRACVQAWASAYRGLVHNLSGGLDSSIVLSRLRRTY